MVNRRSLFAYRRRNWQMFPYSCDTCSPEKRFLRPLDIQNHNADKHGAARFSSSLTVASSSSRMSQERDMFNFSNYSSLTATCRSGASRQQAPTANVREPESLLSRLAPNELNSFVANNIEPDTGYNDTCISVVSRLCEFMKNNFPSSLQPSEIIKSGSLGKGTAVKGKSDADLVVFLSSSEYPTISDIRHNMQYILSEMKTFLNDEVCTYEGKTLHAVKVSVEVGEDKIDVDILPSTDILKQYTDKEIYNQIKYASDVERSFYSAALAPRQLEFVSCRPTKLKTLIRLVKYWRKTAFEESTDFTRLPTSYPLELIVIGEWWNAGKPTDFDLQKGFYNVLKALENYQNIHHQWSIHHEKEDIPSDLLLKPYVIDPANPFNDVMTACNCWPRVADKARDFLTKPLFDDIRYSVSFTSWK